MKNIAYAFFGLLFVVKLQASNYYFSFSTGNDSNPINSQTTPWKTITKLNTLSLLPGDTVFFKRNDTWRGQINANQSGTLAKPIVYTAYSTGSMPKISGAELVSGWSAMGNYYTVPYTTTVGNFFIDDDEMTVARFPNSGYLIQSGSSQSTINSAQITQPEDYWAGTRVCVRTCQWVWETTAVNSSTSGGSLTVAPLLQISPIGNYGFFMYNKLAELDTAREWFYDTAADLLYYYPPTGQNPNSKICEAAVYDNGLQISDNVSNLVLENLWFDKQARNGIAVSNNTSTNIKVKYCTFTKQFLSGVLLRGNYHQVSNCFFRHCDGKGVEVTQGGKSIINHNVFRQIGRYKNSGSGKQTNLEAISLAFVDSVHVHHNNIDSVGYTGIHADGTNHIVEFNILANCMLLLNDGAPLKSFGAPSSNIIYRYNFVSATPGNTEGTYNANFLTPGIYFDFDVSSSLVAFNTIYNSPDVGIFFNGGTNNITALNNIVYGATHNAIFFNASSQPEPMNSMMVKHNKLFALNPLAYIYRQSPNQGTTDFTFGIIDSNYVFQPYSNYVAFRTPNSQFTFSGWQATGNDSHSKPSFVNWNLPTDNSVLFMNPSDTILVIGLGNTKYLDLDQNEICGILTLPPWQSEILINTTTTCNPCTYTPNLQGTSVNVCSNEQAVYTIPHITGATYEWTVTGGTIISGQGTNTITVLWDGAGTGTVQVLQFQ